MENDYEAQQTGSKPGQEAPGGATPASPIDLPSAQDFQLLRAERQESYSQFAASLGETFFPPKRLSKSYIVNVLAGRDPVSRELARAYRILATVTDGEAKLEQAQLEAHTVYAPFSPNGSPVYLGQKPRKCRNPLCNWWFIPGSNFQQYHSPECRKAWLSRKEEKE